MTDANQQTRILVVEDEGIVAKDLQTRLKKMGYEVPLTVQTGEQALQAAQELRPQLILMDVRLKGQMDGIETSARIKQKLRTPVIFLTAYADEQTLGRAKLTEPYGFVLKPFNERELHTVIQVALHKHSTEVALRRSERWLAGTLRSIGDGIIAVDGNRNILFMNLLAQNLTGWTESDATGRPLSEVFIVVDEAPALEPGPNDVAEQTAMSSSITFCAKTLYSKSGRRLPIEKNSAPILDDDGEVAGRVLVFRDITARKNAEEVQRAHEDELRSLANSIAHLAWMANAAGNILWFNQRWYEYTGTTPEQMAGSGWQSVHDPGVLPDMLHRWEQALSTGTTFEMEFPLRGAHGGFRWFLTRVKPVSNGQGKVIRWFGTHTDIHDVRETTEKLRRANLHLEQFAYSAAHDLQEPLRNVALYSQLLGKRYREHIDQSEADYVGYITEGTARMEALVRDLLLYAESGTASEEPVEPVDSARVLTEVLHAMRSSITESDAEITRGDLPVVRIRGMHLRQLFQNLLGNAIKYRAQRKLLIRFDATASASEWIFSVSDNGLGIEPEYREKVFGLFKRLHGANYPGTGLGLALCRNIVTLYGGRIWVDSGFGEGSTFRFTLPLA
jgi:PAS domain S-box-containing protein